jgi:hypothetical protein
MIRHDSVYPIYDFLIENRIGWGDFPGQSVVVPREEAPITGIYTAIL